MIWDTIFQVFLNIELHLADLYPKHSSVTAAVNYRKVRQLSFKQMEDGEDLGVNITETIIKEEADPFSSAYYKIMKSNIEARSGVVADVCR